MVGCGSAGLSAAEALAARVKPSQILVWDVHDGIETRLRRARLAGHGVRCSSWGHGAQSCCRT